MQCKISGGNAVLQARAMYCAITHQFRMFEDNCTQFSGGRFAKVANHNERLSIFNIYPNPASNVLNLIYKIPGDKGGSISLNDITGRQVLNLPITAGYKQIIVNTAVLNAGYYSCHMVIENRVIATQKLIISK
jgi:hypothetical protein